MVIVTKGNDFPIDLQLIKSDSTIESGATVTYGIYTSAVSAIFTGQSAAYNSTIGSYHANVDISSIWSTQDIGDYILAWSVSGVTTSFPPTITENLTVIPGIVDGSYNHNDVLKIIFSALSGKSDGGGTQTIVFKDPSGTTNRITATVTNKGNRTAVALDTT